MENALTKDDLKTLDELLSSTFNSILRIEERSLNNRRIAHDLRGWFA